MQSTKAEEREEEDLSFGCLRANGFPLDYLFKNHGIQFTYQEKQYIQIIYLFYLITFKEYYEKELLPKPCIGTAMELWGLIQITFTYENSKLEHRFRLVMDHFNKSYKINDVVFN